MRVYIINEMQGFRAFIGDKGLTIEKNNNKKLGINKRYIDLLTKINSKYDNISDIYAELCYRLEFDYASVWLVK